MVICSYLHSALFLKKHAYLLVIHADSVSTIHLSHFLYFSNRSVSHRGALDGELDKSFVWAGQVVGLINDYLPHRMVNQFL